jgi:hypothetical protein
MPSGPAARRVGMGDSLVMRRLGAIISDWFWVLVVLYLEGLCEMGLRTCKFCRDNKKKGHRNS